VAQARGLVGREWGEWVGREGDGYFGVGGRMDRSWAYLVDCNGVVGRGGSDSPFHVKTCWR